MTELLEKAFVEASKLSPLEQDTLAQWILNEIASELHDILEQANTIAMSETALLSEAALAEDWNRPEEDEAWSHLQPAQSS